MMHSLFYWIGLGYVAAASALAPLPASAAEATDWPNKPVKFIVPFPPGGSVDPLARLVGARLSAALGQQFIVDNRPGGSGSIGAAAAAKANPDGYTFLFVFDTHAVNPTLIPKLPFDTTKDLVPVMLVGTAPMAIVTHPSKPYKSFADVIKAAKAKPDTLTYGSIGSGSLGHLTMKLHRLRFGARAACEGREAAGCSRHRRQALARTARHPGAGGAGLPRILGARVVGNLWHCRHTQAYPGQIPRGTRKGLQPARPAEATRRYPRHGPRGEPSRGAAEISSRRDCALGESSARAQHTRRLRRDPLCLHEKREHRHG
jgi:hypothetical protein